MKHQLLLAIVFLLNTLLFGQTGRIKVTLIDKENKETIPFAHVAAMDNNNTVGIGFTNIDGECTIDSLAPGMYNIKATYIGYMLVEIIDVKVEEGRTCYIVLGMQVDPNVTIICCITNCYWEPEDEGVEDEFAEYETVDTALNEMVMHSDEMENECPIFKCYPNPTAGQLFVELNENISEVFLSDITGKLLQTYTPADEKLQVDISEFPAGIYFIKYMDEGIWSAEKIVVMH